MGGMSSNSLQKFCIKSSTVRGRILVRKPKDGVNLKFRLGLRKGTVCSRTH